MVIRLIHQTPGLLAGAAIIAATQPAPDNFLLAGAPAAPLPVVLIHGTRDPIAAYEGGAMSWWARRAFRAGGNSLSAPQTAAYFAARNAIMQPPAATDLPHRATGENLGHPHGLPAGRHVRCHSLHRARRRPYHPRPAQCPFILGRTSHDLIAAETISEFFGFTLPPGRTAT